MDAILRSGAVAALLYGIVSPALAQQPASGDPFLPPGEGRELVVSVCTSCHQPRTFGQLRQGPQGWRNVVFDMVMHGAQVGPADIDPIVNYLSTALGPGVPLPGPAPAPVTLADGPGKELVEGGCGLCHGLDRVVATKRSLHQWDAIVSRMIFYGAPLAPDQRKTVLSYLGDQVGTK